MQHDPSVLPGRRTRPTQDAEHLAHELGMRAARAWEAQEQLYSTPPSRLVDPAVQQVNAEYARAYAMPGAYSDDWATESAIERAGFDWFANLAFVAGEGVGS